MAPRKGKNQSGKRGSPSSCYLLVAITPLFSPPKPRESVHLSRLCLCVCVCVRVRFSFLRFCFEDAGTNETCGLQASGNGPAGRSKSVHHSRREKIIRGHVYSENKKKRLQICAPFRPFVPSMVVFAVGRPGQGGCTPRQTLIYRNHTGNRTACPVSATTQHRPPGPAPAHHGQHF